MFKQLSFAAIFSTILLTSGAFAAEKHVHEGKININTASVEVLQNLKHIGKATAEKIVAYREKNDGFKSVDQLTAVRGVGQKVMKANQDMMIIE